MSCLLHVVYLSERLNSYYCLCNDLVLMNAFINGKTLYVVTRLIDLVVENADTDLDHVRDIDQDQGTDIVLGREIDGGQGREIDGGQEIGGGLGRERDGTDLDPETGTLSLEYYRF